MILIYHLRILVRVPSRDQNRFDMLATLLLKGI